MLLIAFTAYLVSWIPCCYTYIRPTVLVEGQDYWDQLGKAELQAALDLEKQVGVARNVIFFIGDGMGISTVTAGRIYRGQKANHPGEEGYLNFEKFPYVGLLKTYNVDKQVPDSAATATALFTGIKTNFYTLGIDASAKFNVCDYTILQRARLNTIADWAQAAGKDTGIVTTTRITHATPAAVFAKSPSRFWECDSQIPVEALSNGCVDIARQLVESETGKKFKVIMGGGQLQLRAKLNATKGSGLGCKRSDGRDLVQDWLDDKKRDNNTALYVSNNEELQAVDIANTDYLLGLFAPGHMTWDQERNRGPSGEPSLAEMTETAIRLLQKNSKGYVLVVEGGRIDHAHHSNLALKSMEEVAALDDAIGKAVELTRKEDTLVLVTADHSHTLTINGYPERGQPIEGATAEEDGFMYETLSYFNGPGYASYRQQKGMDNDVKSTWRDISSMNFSDPTLPHFSAIYMNFSTHGGEDVSIYAQGPMAHLIHGVHEQTYPAYVVAYALCIGPYSKQCARKETTPAVRQPIRQSNEGSSMSTASFTTTYLLAFTICLLHMYSVL